MATPLYSTSLLIPHFDGLNQSGDGYNRNMQYALEMENVNVEGGSFRPMRQGLRIPQELPKPIETLAYLYRRFGEYQKTTLLVAISDRRVYTKQLDEDDDWVQRYPKLIPGDNDQMVEDGDPLTIGECSWLTYEISLYLDYDQRITYAVGERCRHDGTSYRCTTAITTAESWNSSHWEEISNEDPVDILLFTNADDGMFCLYGDNYEVVPVKTPKKFGIITRYYERVWGSGITDDPDMLVYSAPYNPFDWRARYPTPSPDDPSQAEGQPEDGAGDISQPSWDGDRFVAIRQHGNALLAVKRNSIWRINGTDPGTFVMSQQYGGGTIEEDTLISFNEYVYMLGEHGMIRYDGIGAYAFLQDTIEKLMNDQVNHAALDKATAGMRNGTYCLALPINGSTFCNAVLEYDIYQKTLALRTDVSIDSFMQIDERLFYTSATEPGYVFELQDRIGPTLPCKWISGYQDLGQKNAIKSAFVVYLMVDSEAPVELRVGIRTEKKLKQKIVYTKPGKMMRLHLNLQGRTFRLEIQSLSAVPFTISGGARIDLELDPD